MRSVLGAALRDLAGLPARTGADLATHLREAMRWLCRAQDAAGDGGVARSYSLRWQRGQGRRGWLPSYPETTGYIIPTFLDYAAHAGDDDYRDRAIRMAEWEIAVQMPTGAVQGGTVNFPPTPAVFNTGQVLFGWTRAWDETRDERFRSAASRAADFLVEAQDADGAWRRHGSRYARSGVNVYDARSAWGLLEVFRITGEARYRTAAVRNLDFALSRQQANGWFADCCLEDDAQPLLHTIAYAMEGLEAAGRVLGDERFGEAARRAGEALLAGQRADGSLPGRFDSRWTPRARWTCLTANAQTVVVWLRLFRSTGDDRYRIAATRANAFIARTQDLGAADPGVRGGIKGSHPVWGDYAPFEYPNWAAKFFADAVMLGRGLASAPPPAVGARRAGGVA